MRTVITILFLTALGFAQKAVVLISGNGNTNVQSVGAAAAPGGVVVGGTHTTINKHDQTMEMAEQFLKVCPEVSATLDATVAPNYFVTLNREGTWTAFGDMGVSQIMVLDAKKTVLFVGKKGSVKGAVKAACKAVLADWRKK
ncbi:MAG TPA: hypothetical protein VGF06_04290 [Terriglobales bacterium]|jgi:hypothetical protein